jgi:copper(I)-binding protein
MAAPQSTIEACREPGLCALVNASRRIARRMQGALLILAACLVATHASATLTVNLPWIKPTAGGASAEIYLTVTSTDAGEIVAIDTAAARTATLLAPGSGRKRVKAIPLGADTALDLAPGQYRITLDGLARPLKPGEHVPLMLVIRSAAGKRHELAITAEVRKRSAREDEAHAHHQHRH